MIRNALKRLFKEPIEKKGKVLIDGISDSKRCYEIAKKHNKRLLTPTKN